MRKFLVTATIAATAFAMSNACATKKFVRRNTAQLNAKVDSLGRSLEQTQERTRRTETRIVEVDQKVQKVDRTAQTASALAADAAYVAARAGAKMDAIEKSWTRLGSDLVLSDYEGNFGFGATDLPASAKSRLDDVIKRLMQSPQNVHIEIEGHTDNVGDPATNAKIGLARATAVQRYLYEHYQIPLHKMNVISYGEQKPVASNSTRTGRAQNRRIVLRIVA